MNPNEQITVRQAYMAMYQYLKRIYDLTRSDELGGLLGSMSLLPDGEPADPGAWSDWVRAVTEAKTSNPSLELTLKADPD